MKIILIIGLSLILNETIFSQKIVKASGKGEVEFTSSFSENEAKRLSKEQATIAALEAAFGTVMIDGSSTFISNSVSGQKEASKSVYNFISNTAVNGEVIEVLDEKYNQYFKSVILENEIQKVRFMECQIMINARELTAPPIQFETYPLGCENAKCKTFDFKNNDNFFFYFNSPVSGYLWIYLDDGEQAQCLLPYRDMPSIYEGGFPVKADKEYFFFSNLAKSHNLDKLDFTIDTYQLSTEKDQELDRAFIIFSEKPLIKPKVENKALKQTLSDTEIKSGYALPKSVTSENFQKWLIRNRSYKNLQIALKTIDITILKK